MRLEKGMSLTQTRSMKNLIFKEFQSNWITPDDFTDWGWYIKDILSLRVNNNKIMVYTLKSKNGNKGVQVNEETLRLFFSPWCRWQKGCRLLGENFYYKTNQRLTFVKQEYDGKVFKGWSACHAEDTFLLSEGLKIALHRLDEKIQNYKKEQHEAAEKAEKINTYACTKVNKSTTFGSIIHRGDRFGDLEVIAYMGKDSSRHHLWKCRCECGNEIVVRSTNLRNQSKTSCGKCKIKHPVWGNTTEAEKKKIADFINSATVKVEESHYDFTSNLEKHGNLTIVEKEGELLEAPCYNTVVHAVSADYLITGAIGTTKKIIELFNIHDNLVEELRFLRTVAEYDNNAKVVGSLISHPINALSLVVKDSRYDTVKYETITNVLTELKKYICRNKIMHIAMPRICCGRDKLDWLLVKERLIEVFSNIQTPLTITVYNK